MGTYTRAQVAALVDHTLLKPEATEADIAVLVKEAADLDVFAVGGSLTSTAMSASDASGLSNV